MMLDLPTNGGRSEESVDSLERSEIDEQFTTIVHVGIQAGSDPAGHETGLEHLGGGATTGDPRQLVAELEEVLREERNEPPASTADRPGSRERPTAGRE